MHSSRLQILIETLSKVELSRFHKFLDSPYLNSNQKVKDFFNVLMRDEQAKSKKTKEDIWQALYPEDAYNDSKFRKLTSDLSQTILDFLAFEELKSAKMTLGVLKVKALEKKNIPKITEGEIRKLENFLSKQKSRSSNFHLSRFLLLSHLYRIKESTIKRSSKNHTNVDEILDFLSDLNTFTNLESLRHLAAINSWSNLRSQQIDDNYELQVKRNIEELQLTEHPNIRLYLMVLEVQKDEVTELEFDKFISLLFDQFDQLELVESKTLLEVSINYCLRKINKGKDEYLELLHRCYQAGLKHFLFIEDDSISPWTYRNISGVAMRLKKYDWAQTFLEQYKGYLKDEFGTSIYSLSLAQLNFYKKEYNTTLELLQRVEFHDALFKMTAELTLLSTLYELDYYDLLHNALNNFSKFLQRSKNLSPLHISSCKNFARFLKKLNRSYTKKELTQLKEDISKSDQLASKTWLLEKVDELLGIPSNKN